ncbi:hypothetical protein BD311DRAFT_728203 [Dichomitus squalens]|uniref:Store-operated calcium entry-associated regulatory factor n=1 Tax=Dichomitus squalens TaxID=114155 RepID=A0A4Q9MH34_9APHY|nr:hypothetical protein BD311DRAFT_728203 [Dichomitus squalens]
MSRVALSQIRSLTFYQGERTLSRRGQPIPQLKCVGKPCKLYQPEVVRCTSLGGSGTDVDWKCEADLPDSLRFGRVEVSCEGWDGPGDPYVLKGSCGLEYRLVQVPSGLRGGDDPKYPSRLSSWFSTLMEDPVASLFIVLWIFALGLILYHFFKSCFGSRSGTNPRPTPRSPPRTPGSGWFSGGTPRPDNHDPPPPYTKHPSSNVDASGWRPGFWTGAALGGLGAMLMNRNQRQEREYLRPPGMYDWEAERVLRPIRPAPASSSWFGGSSAAPRRRPVFDDDDRGEGPSDLGRMRRSTGLGGSNVR